MSQWPTQFWPKSGSIEPSGFTIAKKPGSRVSRKTYACDPSAVIADIHDEGLHRSAEADQCMVPVGAGLADGMTGAETIGISSDFVDSCARKTEPAGDEPRDSK